MWKHTIRIDFWTEDDKRTTSNGNYFEINSLEGEPSMVETTAQTLIEQLKKHYPTANRSRYIITSRLEKRIEL